MLEFFEDWRSLRNLKTFIPFLADKVVADPSLNCLQADALTRKSLLF